MMLGDWRLVPRGLGLDERSKIVRERLTQPDAPVEMPLVSLDGPVLQRKGGLVLTHEVASRRDRFARMNDLDANRGAHYDKYPQKRYEGGRGREARLRITEGMSRARPDAVYKWQAGQFRGGA